jgi:hypothetical protein
MCALINSEELLASGQIMVKQLKNRWNDPNYYKKFILGVDRSKMKLFDLEDSAQDGITDAGQPTKDDEDEQQHQSIFSAAAAKKYRGPERFGGLKI